MNKAILTQIILCFAALFAIVALGHAQDGSISGKLTGKKDGDAPVLQLLRTDSSIAKTTVAAADGSFSFEKLKAGSYIISIREMGYAPYWSNTISITPDRLQVTVPDIPLTITATELQGVQVTATRRFVQRLIDRVVVNPDALIGNAGTTSLDILEKSPGVLVDLNGNISMKGKPGVMIFVDDKPTYLAAADLANFLRTIPAGNVESIELMVNPPAKYDAAGNAGIINIKLKKNVARGVNGGINLSYGQGTYARSNNSFNINYRINKINFFGNVGVNQNNSYQDLTINRYYFLPNGNYNSGFSQNSYIKMQMGSRTARLGMDYYLNKKNTLGVVFAGFINPQKTSITNRADVLDENYTSTLTIRSFSPTDRKWKNGSANLNYAYKIDNKGRELSANADYIVYTSKHAQYLDNKTFAPDNSLLNSSLLNSSLPADITIQSIIADYVHPMQQFGKLDAGAKFSGVRTDNNALFYDVVNGNETPNNEFTNRFKYKEQITAGYLNYSNNWKKLSVQLGLRLEHTLADGYQYGNAVLKDSSFRFQYSSFFPTAFFLYRLDSLQKHQLGLSVGRRIQRPNYKDLNPFTYPIDLYTFYGGNPFLQPTFSYNIELSHTYKNFFTTTVEYSVATNLIQETNEQRGTVYYSRPGNFGKQKVYGASVNGNFNLRKWWILQLYSEAKNISVESINYGQTINESRWYWYIGPTNQFVITPLLSAELAGSYQTRILAGQFLTIAVWQMRAGLSYKILKGNGSVKLNVSDMFYTNQPGGDIRNIANSKANWLSYLDSRVGTLSFSYRFNKGKSLQARQSGAADSEKGRVKIN